MARVTVEDCVLRIPNRFELVLLAAQRSRDVSSGSLLTVERDNDKNPVVALREIAEGSISTEALQTSVIHNMQRHVEPDEPEEDDFDQLSAEVSADLKSLMAAQESADLDGFSLHEEAVFDAEDEEPLGEGEKPLEEDEEED